MTEGYCDKCKATCEILNPVEEQLKNGRHSIRGRCPVCGSGLFKMVPSIALENAEPLDEPDNSYAPLSPSIC